MASILETTKKMLGLEPSDTAFDTDIIIDINAVLMILNQLGLGPEAGFSISDNTATWETFLTNVTVDVEAVKSYMALKVRLLFDPPTSAAAIDAMNNLVKEFEYRLAIQVEEPVVPDVPLEGE